MNRPFTPDDSGKHFRFNGRVGQLETFPLVDPGSAKPGEGVIWYGPEDDRDGWDYVAPSDVEELPRNQTAWERAVLEKRKVFYEPETETLRTAPENYLLAFRRESTTWVADPDTASKINPRLLALALERYFGRDDEALAAALEKEFFS